MIHCPFMVLELALRWRMEGSPPKKKKGLKIFIAMMTPSTQTPSWMTEQLIGFPFLTGRWYSLRVFFFHLSVYFSLSGDVRAAVCSSPAVTARVCTDGRQVGRAVYCFRPCGVPGITDGLDLFPSVSPSPQVQSGRPLAATSKDTPIGSDPKQNIFFEISAWQLMWGWPRPPKHSCFPGNEGKQTDVWLLIL